MADVQKNTNSAVAWIAIIAVAIALPIAIVAYNRSGEDLDDTVKNQTANVSEEVNDTADDVGAQLNEVKQEMMESAAQMQARAELSDRLNNVRQQAADNQVTDDTVAEVQLIRSDFKNAYADATGKVKTEVDQIDEDLEKLETEVRQNTANAILTIDSVLERMRRDVLVDENDE